MTLDAKVRSKGLESKMQLAFLYAGVTLTVEELKSKNMKTGFENPIPYLIAHLWLSLCPDEIFGEHSLTHLA